MASLEDFEESQVKKVAEVEVLESDEFGPDEADIAQDILDALSLLSKCMHLLDYLSDPDLCKSVTKRERDSMSRLSESVRTYLDAVEGNYVEGEEE